MNGGPQVGRTMDLRPVCHSNAQSTRLHHSTAFERDIGGRLYNCDYFELHGLSGVLQVGGHIV